MIAQLLAAASLLAAQTTTAPTACITKAQAGDVAVVFMASAVSASARQCASVLPATAFLRNADGAAYMQRLNTAASARRASALAALNRVLPGGSGAEALLSALETTPEPTGMTASINAAVCPEGNRMFEALAPLPPENLGTFVGAMTGMTVAIAPIVQAAAAGEARAPGARPIPAGPNPFAMFCRE